jgi:hypothetical protein
LKKCVQERKLSTVRNRRGFGGRLRKKRTEKEQGLRVDFETWRWNEAALSSNSKWNGKKGAKSRHESKGKIRKDREGTKRRWLDSSKTKNS